MKNILTQSELLAELENFKFTLQHFDYSDIKNIIFFNLEALYSYIETVEDNPFKLQYEKLQQILDIIESYIPFVIDGGFISTMDLEEESIFDELEDIKESLSETKRLNFTNFVRIITSDDEWQNIIDMCKDIRDKCENSQILVES